MSILFFIFNDQKKYFTNNFFFLFHFIISKSFFRHVNFRSGSEALVVLFRSITGEVFKKYFFSFYDLIFNIYNLNLGLECNYA